MARARELQRPRESENRCASLTSLRLVAKEHSSAGIDCAPPPHSVFHTPDLVSLLASQSSFWQPPRSTSADRGVATDASLLSASPAATLVAATSARSPRSVRPSRSRLRLRTNRAEAAVATDNASTEAPRSPPSSCVKSLPFRGKLDAAERDATQAAVPAQLVVNAADDYCALGIASECVDNAVLATTVALASTAAPDGCGFAVVVPSAKTKAKTALENKVSCISFGCMTEYLSNIIH